MRKIDLKYYSPANKNSIRTENKMYSIFIGPGQRKLFKNKKAAAAFLVNLNKDLNNIIVELNYLAGEIYGYYRANFLYLNTDLSEQFKTVDFHLNMSLSMPGGPGSQTTFTINHIYKCIDSLEGVLGFLQKVSKKLNLHLQNKNYGAVALRLAAIREFLKAY